MSRSSAPGRVARLLAIVPWVAAHPDGASIEEVCRRFDVSESKLLEDLNILPFVGVAPFTADTLLDVVVEDGRIWIHPQWFDRPLRLTAAQGLALVAAGEGLAEVQGADPDGPLARGLAKVARSLGIGPGESVDVDLGPGDRSVLDAVNGACRQRRQLVIEYYAYGRDEKTERVIEPWAVFNEQGAWYVDGWCHLAGDERLFRVDRISSADVLDKEFTVAWRSGGDGNFNPRPDDPRVTVDIAPEAAWVAERYPCEHIEELDEGYLRIRLICSGRAWLERLLLRLGPAAQVVEADGGLEAAGAQAARRVLDVYARHPTSPGAR